MSQPSPPITNWRFTKTLVAENLRRHERLSNSSEPRCADVQPEHCRIHHMQTCHCCPEFHCGDNRFHIRRYEVFF